MEKHNTVAEKLNGQHSRGARLRSSIGLPCLFYCRSASQIVYPHVRESLEALGNAPQ